jgi:tetratricopeptide (TPR) repeat protein
MRFDQNGRTFVSATVTGIVVSVAAFTAPAAAQFPPDSFVNLKVLPRDIETRALIDMMAGFTRALGVRCEFCHVGEEGMPLAQFDFPADDKVTKRKARQMLRIVQAINDEYLTDLTDRAEPPVEVRCATCHRGVTEPRPIEDIVVMTFERAGIDSAIARYRELRAEYYGRASYDFGDVPLIDAARAVRRRTTLADAVKLLDLNLEYHPDEPFARQMHAAGTIELAFLEGGPPGGRAKLDQLYQTHQPDVVAEALVNNIGYGLLRGGKVEEAIAAFRWNVETYPQAANTYDSLGEALLVHGDTASAVTAYRRSLELNPDNTNAVEKLRQMGAKPERF